MQVTFDSETCNLIDQIKGDKSRFAWFRKEFKELLKKEIDKQNTHNESEYEVTTNESERKL